MSTMMKRLLFPTSLAVIGLACIIGGAGFHTQTVQVSKEVKSAVPQQPPSALRFLSNQPPAPPKPPTQYELVMLDETELQLTREVTVGGVTRMKTGVLKRTYMGDTPSLCPT